MKGGGVRFGSLWFEKGDLVADTGLAVVLVHYDQWSCSPACTELEQVMLDWGAKLLGLQETFWNSSKRGGGQITVRFTSRVGFTLRDYAEI